MGVKRRRIVLVGEARRVPDMKPIKAKFCGYQESPSFPSFELWTILEPIDGHPMFSTVSVDTLTNHGYTPQEEPGS